MAEQLTSLADSMEGLRLVDRTPGLSDSDSNRPKSNQVHLVEAIRALIQSAEATTTHAQQVESLVESTHTGRGYDIAQLSSLRRKANALASITETFSNATERYVVTHVTSFAGPGTLVQKILSYFDGELRSIAQDVLNSTSDDSNVLRGILEMCYNQAFHPSGTLHSDNYFIPLGEASLEWPYDPDFESEEYYNHEDRLDTDDSYAETFRMQCERKLEKERQQEEEWIAFWVQALSKCPDGPTLFYPPASRRPECHLADVPRYLFRAFDHRSSGRNDHNVVASMESISVASWRSRVDLLSRTEKEATGMLHRHLTKPCFEGEAADNLISWSSSLLFVIQYAIWRCHLGHYDPTEVKICTVDTRKFPYGQFARDMSLLREYREAPELDKKMQRFFDFRLGDARYDNGEYLSQGLLQHTGRSSVVSLAQLIQAGLHDLYPEFADPVSMGSWTNRVKDLRSEWSVEHTTTQLDIQRACKITRTCFHVFDETDMALLLLTFRNRKLRASTTTVKELRENLDDYGPEEVQRYMEIVETMMPNDRSGYYASHGLRSFNTLLLEKIFECS